MEAIKQDKLYTVDDYLYWDDDESYEVIDGIVYNHCSSLRHQDVSSEILSQISAQLDKRRCKVFAAPSDVVLDDYTVVQPDIFVICDRSRYSGDRFRGGPELVIEILSKSSELRDNCIKMKKYKESKVSEYWIVDFSNGVIKVHDFSGNSEGEFGKDSIVVSSSVVGVEVNFKTVFDNLW